MPDVPVIPKSTNVARPATAVFVCVPTNEPPLEIVAVMIDVESAVTVFPEASLIVIVG